MVKLVLMVTMTMTNVVVNFACSFQISVHDPMEHLMLLLTSFFDMKFDEYSVPILNMFSDIVLKVFHVKQK